MQIIIMCYIPCFLSTDPPPFNTSSLALIFTNLVSSVIQSNQTQPNQLNVIDSVIKSNQTQPNQFINCHSFSYNIQSNQANQFINVIVSVIQSDQTQPSQFINDITRDEAALHMRWGRPPYASQSLMQKTPDNELIVHKISGTDLHSCWMFMLWRNEMERKLTKDYLPFVWKNSNFPQKSIKEVLTTEIFSEK